MIAVITRKSLCIIWMIPRKCGLGCEVVYDWFYLLLLHRIHTLHSKRQLSRILAHAVTHFVVDGARQSDISAQPARTNTNGVEIRNVLSVVRPHIAGNWRLCVRWTVQDVVCGRDVGWRRDLGISWCVWQVKQIIQGLPSLHASLLSHNARTSLQLIRGRTVTIYRCGFIKTFYLISKIFLHQLGKGVWKILL